MTPIEQKEIKGLTARNIWVIIASTAITVGTVYGTVNGLKSSLNDLKTQIMLMQKDRDSDRKYYDLKMDQLQQQVNIMQGQQNNIKDRLEDMESDKLFHPKK